MEHFPNQTPGSFEWFTTEPRTHEPYNADDRGVILLEKRSDDYMAFLNYDRTIWACGKTQQEAIGELWRIHSDAIVDKILNKAYPISSPTQKLIDHIVNPDSDFDFDRGVDRGQHD